MTKVASEIPARALLWISLIQGACLYHLYGSIAADRWPATSPVWAFPLWTLAVFAPIMLLLSITRANLKRVAFEISVACSALALLGVYIGLQATPVNQFPISNLVTTYVITMGIAGFKILAHIQRRSEGAVLSYSSLFTNSWRNFLTGILATVFALLFWLIMLLWGGLFSAIGVDFFQELFVKDWFAIPSVTLAFGIGVILFRNLTRVIDSITQLLHGLMKLLLPLLILLSGIFLLALPFTGLSALWETGSGTALLLWLLALTLFAVNAVYQDGREANPYPEALNHAIYGGICLTPILSALAFYGLYLRLMQYGWTVERCWAFVTWLVLTLVATGYVVGIARRRDNWIDVLTRVNVTVGLVMLSIMLFANSPALDFRKITLSSQTNRVEAGDLELGEFDFWYTKQHLVRPGYLYMEAMKRELGDSDPVLLAEIENPTWRRTTGVKADTESIWARVEYRPTSLVVSPTLKAAISTNLFPTSDRLLLVEVDLDEDGFSEYLLFQKYPYNAGVGQARLYYRENDEWLTGNVLVRNPTADSTLDKLIDGDVELHPRKYQDLEIGGVRLSVQAW